MVGYLHGLEPRLSKTDLIGGLINMQAPPVYPAAAAHYKTRATAVMAGHPDPGPLPNTHHVLRAAADGEPRVALADVGAASANQGPGNLQPALVNNQPVQQYVLSATQLMQILAEHRSNPGGPDGPVVAVPSLLSKLDLMLAESQKKVDAQTYFDPMVLCDSHRNKLRQAGVNARQETCVSVGVYMSTAAPSRSTRPPATTPSISLKACCTGWRYTLSPPSLLCDCSYLTAWSGCAGCGPTWLALWAS